MVPASIPRAALVTGGAARLGRAVALALAEAGFAVAVHYRSAPEAAEATAAELRQLGVAAATLPAELGDEAQTTSLLERAADALGPIGVLVNNASLFDRDSWNDVTRTSWDSHLEPNLRAPFVLSQGFARALPAGAEGVVINMLDARVWALTPNFVSYTVSKAGLWALTQSLALALAPRIRVNGIGPGPTLQSTAESDAEFARLQQRLPLGHGATAAEVGRAAIAILSLPSLTGQMLALDGGQHLQ